MVIRWEVDEDLRHFGIGRSKIIDLWVVIVREAILEAQQKALMG